MRVDEVQAGGRPPVSQQARLDVLETERLAQQWVVAKVDLADRQVVGGPPVPVDQGELRVGEGPRRVRRTRTAHQFISSRLVTVARQYVNRPSGRSQ